MTADIAVAGAGFTGAVIARELAEAGFRVDVYEVRDHVGGNCYSQRDVETGILVHKYGPHIFHTDDKGVWEYINQWSDFHPYVNRVKAVSDGKVYSLPVNLHTINQIYGSCLSPQKAFDLIQSEADLNIQDPKNFEEQALRFIGPKLYKAFFYGYTRKQWGRDPKELPASILKRLPVRFNYDDNYFSHKFQGMPVDGYTPIFERMLDHVNISVHLGMELPNNHYEKYFHTFYSGPIDRYFDYSHGRLGYRSLRFEEERLEGDFQGCAVMNYCDFDVPYTRITEHKHFSPWESFSSTLIYREYSFEAGPEDIPFYPIRLADDKEMLEDYIQLARAEKRTTFAGRLGTYRYLDMDVTIREAIDIAAAFIKLHKAGNDAPAFFVSPI